MKKERCRDCTHLDGTTCDAPLPVWLGDLLDSLPCDIDNEVDSATLHSCRVFRLSEAAKCSGCAGMKKRYIGLNGWPKEDVDCWDCGATGRAATRVGRKQRRKKIT